MVHIFHMANACYLKSWVNIGCLLNVFDGLLLKV